MTLGSKMADWRYPQSCCDDEQRRDVPGHCPFVGSAVAWRPGQPMSLLSVTPVVAGTLIPDKVSANCPPFFAMADVRHFRW